MGLDDDDCAFEADDDGRCDLPEDWIRQRAVENQEEEGLSSFVEKTYWRSVEIGVVNATISEAVIISTEDAAHQVSWAVTYRQKASFLDFGGASWNR